MSGILRLTTGQPSLTQHPLRVRPPPSHQWHPSETGQPSLTQYQPLQLYHCLRTIQKELEHGTINQYQHILTATGTSHTGRCEMELLLCSLLCALFTSVSCSPTDLRQHQDADIPDSDLTSDLDWTELWLRSRFTALGTSSESQSSEESSEEPALTQAPPTESPPPPPPPASSALPTGVPVAMTTATVVTPGTDLPTVVNSTASEPCPTTGCVTVDIPTSPPVTGSRGDN